MVGFSNAPSIYQRRDCQEPHVSEALHLHLAFVAEVSRRPVIWDIFGFAKVRESQTIRNWFVAFPAN